MVDTTLGDQIDIHGGGRDLVYPHHESEIAQSESYTGKTPYVNTWMHTAMLMYQGEKMSKSLGNMLFASDLLKKYSPNTLRWVLLSHHYRTPWEFEDQMADEAEKITSQFDSFDKSSQFDSQLFEKLCAFTETDLQIPQALQMIEQNLGQQTKEEESAIKKYLEIIGFTF
jgi:cysteinyl-tRNA synthetase